MTHALDIATGSHAGHAPSWTQVRHRTVEVDGVRVFYREAGRPGAPAILLLHGFPTSSHMFRHLIPALADRYRVIAPDYPGFGHSDFPAPAKFEYSFSNFARLLQRFTWAVGLQRYALYLQDYGAPIGLRLALLAPERVSGLVVQNGNAYEEGLSSEWDALKAFWADPSPQRREKLRGWLTAEGIRMQYAAGLPANRVEQLSPDTWLQDWALLCRPGNIEMQLGLFADYRSNVDLYPAFHEYFRTYRPPTLITWGRHDPFFTVEGALAFARDLPDAQTHFLDGGHFALETHLHEIAALVNGHAPLLLHRAA
jgi:pimeloyl-ACP methyl ester carboxylesterase